MSWKHIKNIDETSQSAEMFIYDEISSEKVNGANFAYEMRYLIDYQGVKTIKVKINSVGGDVMHAQTIINEIIDAKEKGVTVETYGAGLMASSAGVIWLTAEAKNRYAKDYARLMVHGVSTAEEGDLSEDDKTALENFKNILVQILSNRTGKKASYFEDLFTNGRDNWFNTKDMVKSGLLLKDNIEQTGVTVDITEKEITAGGVAVVINKFKALENNLITKKETTMKKVIALLGLQEAASEEVVETAVLAVQNKLNTAEEALKAANNRLEDMQTKLDAANGSLEAANKLAAAEFVKNCIKEGKIDPAHEAAVLVQAETNLEGFKNLMAAIPVKAVNIISKIENGGQAPAATGETRSFRQLEKEAPHVLNAMRTNDLQGYVNLYNAQYGTNKTAEDFAKI